MKFLPLVLGILLSHFAYSNALFSIEETNGIIEIKLLQFDPSTGTNSMKIYRQNQEITFDLDGGKWVGSEISNILYIDPLNQDRLILHAQNILMLGNSLRLIINDDNISSSSLDVEIESLALPLFPKPGLFSITVKGLVSVTDDFNSENSDVYLCSLGNISISGILKTTQGDLLLKTSQNLSQTAPVSGNQLGLIISGTTLMTNGSNNFKNLSIDNQSETLYTDIDGIDVSKVSLEGTVVSGINTTDDDVKLTTGGNLSISEAISLGAGDLLLSVTGNASQSASISGESLGLMVAGTSYLLNAANNFSTIATDNQGELVYTDVDALTVGTVTVDGMTVTGIVSTDDDVKFTTGGNFSISEAISLGAGDLLLSVTGNASQSASISGESLGLMVAGTSYLLNAANNFSTIATDNQGELVYTDVDALTVGSVTVDGMTVTGIVSTDDDVKLTTGGSLSLSEAISLGAGDLLLSVTGNASQSASISGESLGLMVAGTSYLLNAANNFSTIATDNQGELVYTDVDALTVGTVTVDGMTVTGIVSIDDDVKLTTGGNLSLLEAISLGAGDLLLSVTGNASQSASISGEGLGLMITGTSYLLNAANNFSTIATDNQGELVYTDVDALTVGTVTVDGMTVTGIVSTDDDVKLTTGGNLSISEAISLGAGDLLLSVTGNASQSASISGESLGLMVAGTSYLLNAANNFSTIATDNQGELVYTDVDALTVGSVTVDGMTVTGIVSTDDDVKLTTGGSLSLSEAISLGAGDLLLSVTGNASQSASISGESLGLMVAGTSYLLNAANNFSTIATDNQGELVYTDVDALTVGTVTVDGMTVTGIVSIDDDVKLTTGGNLSLLEAISLGAGDLLLSVTGNASQSASISGEGLGLMITGTSYLLNAANNFSTIATDNQGELVYTDVDALTVGTVTVDGMTVTGIVSTDDDVKLTTGGNLSISEAISLGAGDLLLSVTGNASQSASISGESLGLMVAGTSYLLNAANNFSTIATDNQGELVYTDVDALSVGTVTVDGMTVTGIVSTDDDVKLTTGGSLSIFETVNLGIGSLLLQISGNISQSAAITGSGLGIEALGSISLTDQLDDFKTIAVESYLLTEYFDKTDLTIGTVSVDGISIGGILNFDNDTTILSEGDLTVEQNVGTNGGANAILLQSFTQVEILPSVETALGDIIMISIVD